MELRRKSDNLLLTDRVFNWTAWFEPPAPRRDTVNAVPTNIVMQKSRPRTTTISVTFSDDDPNSNMADLAEIRRLHHRNQIFLFKDRTGAVTEVRVIEWTENSVWDEVKVKTVLNVDFLLYDIEVRY